MAVECHDIVLMAYDLGPAALELSPADMVVEALAETERPSIQELRVRMGYPDIPFPTFHDWPAPEHYSPTRYTATTALPYITDPEHLPADALLCPGGPTGLIGYGRFRRAGPNESEDAVTTRVTDDGDTEILLIERTDTGQLAPPGGFRDTGEKFGAAAPREVTEETSIVLPVHPCRLIYSGFALSARNTDWAWAQNTAFHWHLTAEQGRGLVPHAPRGADSKRALWLPLSEVDPMDFSYHHGLYIRWVKKELLTEESAR